MSVLRFALLSVIFLSSTLWASVGKVALLKGEAVAERNAQTITLQNGSLVEDKDAIKTGKDAQVQLLFEDKTVITLGSESEFKIEEYLNDATNPKAKFKFNQGTFKTITGQIGKTAPDNFKMETKTATIGIRGTIVKGSTGDKGDVIACLRGLITVMSRHTGAVVEVPAGQYTTIQGNASPSTPQETKPGTTDDSLANNTPPPTSPAPTTVASVEQTKNDGLAQSTFATRGLLSGTYAIEGLATHDNDSNPYYLSFSVNRATAEMTGSLRNSEEPVHSLDLSGGDFVIFNSVEQELGVFVATPYPILVRGTGDNLGVYASDDLFLRQGFFNNGDGIVGYFGTFTMNESEYTSGFSSQYVSWGIWGETSIDDESSNWLEYEQYWVAGPTITPSSVITSLINNPTQYTYNGQVLGKTYNGTTWNVIDTATSDVKLIFNFGSTSSLSNTSYIRFNSDSTVWDLAPTGALTLTPQTSKFFTSLTTGTTNGAVSITTASINGKFFGSNAQAVGGILNATAESNTKKAVGVFKAVR